MSGFDDAIARDADWSRQEALRLRAQLALQSARQEKAVAWAAYQNALGALEVLRDRWASACLAVDKLEDEE